MNRRDFFKAAGFVGISCVLPGCSTAVWQTENIGSKEKPNIIVLFADDLGYGDLGSYGHPTISTPNIDRMAYEGQRWTNFYAASSLCSPSRAGLMTGKYPIRSGTDGHVFFEWSADGLSSKEITVAEMLKRQGYKTSCVGKWHLGHQPEFLPTNQGFDEYFGIPYSNDMRVDPYMQVAEKINLRNGVTLEQMRDPQKRKNDWVPLMEDEVVVEYPCDQTTLTKRYTERCVDYIKENRDEPFFLYMAHSFPHVPLFASDEFLGKSRRGLYGDVVEELDASVGTILQTLRDLNLDKNTLVVFTSDNGPWLSKFEKGGSAGLLRGGKGQTFEGGMREPCIFWWPGHIQAGSVVRDIGSTLDFYKTFGVLAGAGVPGEHAVDSYDLSSAILGSGESLRKDFFYYRNNEIYAVRYGMWKAHFITEGSFRQGPEKTCHQQPLLYHLGQDPSEKYDVSKEHPDVIKNIRELKEKHCAGVEAVASRYEKKFDWKESK
ncbi:MAG: sulfatase [Sedimentisphaeraceae bacterium JB056]